ncbi:MAG: DUF3791 domain-containing protein [Bacteroidales bacterium]|nr:DUF3791 domain-containing protein [Bacteroidales bacterium]
MTSKQSHILEYLICCIGAFAERFSISNQQAYQHLKKYQALDFLKKHYDIEHTLSIDDAVDDCARICQRHGGDITL